MRNAAVQKQALPLKGVRVLELSHIVAGPSGGMMLGDLGADVIKVEHPSTGDTARSQANEGNTFYTYNRNKQFLALDLRQAKGKAIFEKLVKQSDIVLDNFAPGALQRLGLDYSWGSKVNPRIIYCSVKGFLPGPYGDRPFLDELAQMAGGIAYLTGFEGKPMRAGASITDIGAATYGVGDCIEAGLYETVVFWISQYITGAQLSGKNPPPRGEQTSGMGKAMGWGVYQLFPTKGGKPVFIAVTGNRHWVGLCDVLGFDDWKNSAEFNTNRKRTAEKWRIAERITAATQLLTYDDITARLYKALVPYAPVGTPLDILADKHMGEAGRWMQLKVGDKQLKVPKLPFAMGGTEDFEAAKQPAFLGEHTDTILASIGYTPAEVAALKAEKVVLRSNKMLNIEGQSE